MLSAYQVLLAFALLLVVFAALLLARPRAALRAAPAEGPGAALLGGGAGDDRARAYAAAMEAQGYDLRFLREWYGLPPA